MPDQDITCPKCKNKIPLTKALFSQIKEEVKNELAVEQEKRNKELEKERENLQKKEADLEKRSLELEKTRNKTEKLVADEVKRATQKVQEEFSKKEQELQKKNLEVEKTKKGIDAIVAERTKQEVDKLKKETTEQIKKENAKELEFLKNQLTNKDTIIDDFKNQELKLRNQKNELEEDKKLFEVRKHRELDDAKKEIREKALVESAEQNHLKNKEKDKIIESLKKSLEDAQRKANQGSQQLQGEVQELDLEEILQRAFPLDIIEPIGKGVKGADVRQIVKTKLGNVCGVILWESKRTKTWSDDWVAKLKDDLRAEKANIPVVVTETFPKGVNSNLIFKDGVWVCGFGLILPFAEMVRQRLLEVAKEKFISQNRTEKAESLYAYVTGHEFRQQVEAMAEVYQDMHLQIMKEKTAFEKIWKTREAQVQKLFLTTGGIVGSMAGKIGTSMLQIKGLELLESGEEETVPKV